MRVGLISGEFPPQRGGVGDYTRLLARYLAARGLDIQILTHRAARSTEETFPVHSQIGHWGFNALLTTRRWAADLRLDLRPPAIPNRRVLDVSLGPLPAASDPPANPHDLP